MNAENEPHGAFVNDLNAKYDKALAMINQLTVERDAAQKELATTCEDRDAAILERDAALSSAKYWKEQQLVESDKRAVCENELDEARGNLAEQIERIERERDAALKACGEMRKCIESISSFVPCSFGTTKYHDQIHDCLSTDCGKDYIHRDEIKPLVEAFKKIYGYGKGDLTVGELCDYVNETCEEAFAHAKKVMEEK